jgi:hypothetical protein
MTATLFDTTPAWVLDELERAGLGHIVTTHRRVRATPRRHDPCRAPIWQGLCDREDVTLDPTPTTPDGELYAILTGRRTYEMNWHGEISRRHPAHIRDANADQVRVYIAHACQGPYPIVNNRWAPLSKSQSDEIPY